MLPEGLEDTVKAEFLKVCDGIRMDVTSIGKRRVWVETDASSIKEALTRTKQAWPEVHLSTITGLDDGDAIEIIYHFVVDGVLINMRTRVSRSDSAVETVTPVLPAADSFERELHDLLGVMFLGRESTPRLVLPDEWEDGVYPLRKGSKGDGQSV
jgi:Ni,Fe-hydrogenase III component G